MFMRYSAAKNIFRESYHRIPCCEFHFPFFSLFFFWSVLLLHIDIYKTVHTYEGSPKLAVLLGAWRSEHFLLVDIR